MIFRLQKSEEGNIASVVRSPANWRNEREQFRPINIKQRSFFEKIRAAEQAPVVLVRK